MLVSLSVVAFAAVPVAAHRVEVPGDGVMSGLAVSDDGALVTAVNGSSVVILDTDAWRGAQESPCAVASAVPAANGDGFEIWAACNDGTLARVDWADGVATIPEDTQATVEIGGDPLVWIGYDETDGILAVISKPATGAVVLHRVDFETLDVDADSGAITLGYDGFVDAVLVDGSVYVAHGQAELTRTVLASGAATPSLDRTGISINRMAPASSASVYAIDTSGTLAWYDPSLYRFQYVGTNLGSLSAVGTWLGGDGDVPWIALAAGTSVDVYDLAGVALDGDPVASFDMPTTVSDFVTGPDGTLYAGSDDGGILVATAGPWVSDVAATPTTGTDGTEVAIGFTLDVDAHVVIARGGDATGGGTTLFSADEAAGAVSIPLIIDGWAEGANPIYVFATDDAGNEGHGSATVTVDNPPEAPSIDAANLGFLDGGLRLSFDGLDAEDIATYTVYVTVTPFTRADWPTGGPEFDGSDDLAAPITVDAASSLTVDIAPLTNGVTYYVAVRATDAGGLEGPMSAVVSGTPSETYSASELAGETGGPAGCATGGPALAGLGLAALAVLRRRRGLAVAAGLGLASVASAAPEKDLTPQHGNFELRYGPVMPTDPHIQDVYTNKKTILQLEMGPQLFHVLELDFGAGFFQTLAYTLDSGGGQSSERTMLTYVPLTVDLTGRLQLLDEQVLVPHARIGLDEVWWREDWDVSTGGKTGLKGEKRGWHYGFGGALLLDTFAKARASQLETASGINDTYLIAEWRHTNVGQREGLDLSGNMVTVGLKLDF
jgi:uncharacterized protein (TIGR03382 family)